MPASQAAALGIDLGTSSVKALLLGLDGVVLAEASAPYPTLVPRRGRAEQDPDAWWEATCDACRAALSGAPEPLDVAGIGLSGQMHTFVLVDEEGTPVRPAITWQDARAAPDLAALAAEVDRVGLLPRLANRVVLGTTLPALAWVARQEPGAVARARWLLGAKDLLRMRMTGAAGAEPTDASATLLFDVQGRRWCGEVLDLIGVPRRTLPPLGASSVAAGTLGGTAAAELGLPSGIAVAYGAGDQQAAALGMGTIAARSAQVMVGTGAQVLTVVDRAPATPHPSLHAFCHVEGYLLQGSVNAAGAALAWMHELLGVPWEAIAERAGRPDAGPVFLPFLTGERTPLMKPHARGAWLGLSHEHTAADLGGAAVDGVVATIADAVATLRAAAEVTPPLRVGGGVLRDPRIVRALSDATGLPLACSAVASPSALGAAMLGGVAAGAYDGIDDAVRRAVPVPLEIVAPDDARADAWAARRALGAALDAAGLHEVVAGLRPGDLRDRRADGR